MKICIVGAGAIGGMIGIQLALAGEQVTFTLDGGSVTELRFGGQSMWPENRWADVEKQLFQRSRKAR